MKTTTSITVDVEVLQLAKEKYPGEISSLINNFLKTLISEQIKSNSKEAFINELREINEKEVKNAQKKLILGQKLQEIDEKEVKNEENRQEMKEIKEKEKEVGEELKEPLTLREIEFFNNLNPKSNDVFNMNFYNNTFYRQFNEKQYLKRFKKFNDEIKPLPRL